MFKRSLWLKLHRILAIVLLMPLLILLLTGSVLVFKAPLDRWLNPELMQLTALTDRASFDSSRVLSIAVLEQNIAQAYPGSRISWFDLSTYPDKASVFWLAGFMDKQGNYQAPEHNQIFVNPYTGEVLGGRTWGSVDQPLVNLMPLVYRLHYSLLLGATGAQWLGWLAIAWLSHLSLGWVLTWPQGQQATTKQKRLSWLGYWRFKPVQQARSQSEFKKQFSWHRWLGLILTPMMLIFIVSAIAFNLKEIYHPVLDLFAERQQVHLNLSVSKEGLESPMSWSQAEKVGKQHMTELAEQQSFEMLSAQGLSYSSFKGVYMYRAYTSLDISTEHIRTSVWFDAASGERLAEYLPSQKAAGDSLTNLISALHLAKLGFIGKILVLMSSLGLMLLIYSGAKVGWMKWRARRKVSWKNKAAIGKLKV